MRILVHLSELPLLKDVDLVDLHDVIHEEFGVTTNSLRKRFWIWYHKQVVSTMSDQDIVHTVAKGGLDDERVDFPDYEIRSKPSQGHQHTVVLFEDGSGFTDPASDHAHMVFHGKTLESDGHTHEVTLPEDLVVGEKAPSEKEVADAAWAAMQKMAREDFSTLSLKTRGGNHQHRVVVFDEESGFGLTNSKEDHVHVVFGWLVQESKKHTHDLDRDSSTTKILSASSAPKKKQEKQQQPRQKKTADKSEPKSLVEFGRPSIVRYESSRVASPEEALEQWTPETNPILITPHLSGVPVEAHIDCSSGIPSVKIFAHGEDATTHFRQAAESLALINLQSVSKAVISGVIALKNGKTAKADTLEQLLYGINQGDMAVFYGEDCWYLNGSLEELSAKGRRRKLEVLLANSSTPSLKHLQRAIVDNGEKALRVTNIILKDDGFCGARWRSVSETLSREPKELIVS